MANDQFKPKGLYRIYAYILGLTKYRSAIFYDDYFELTGSKLQAKLKYSDVKEIRKGGLLLNNLKFLAGKKYIFRGLSKNDFEILKSKFLKAEKNAWQLRLKLHEHNLRLISKWIDDVKNRSHFQRESVFRKRYQTAEDLNKSIVGSVPQSIIDEQLAVDLLKVRAFLKNARDERAACNRDYIPLEKERQKDLLDGVEANPLTEEQRSSVVTDEDANLVIASAGSGKTSVIVAKAAWLLAKELRKPSEILLLAFAKDARIEMATRLQERIPNLPENSITVHTFHSLGLEILGQSKGKKPSLSKLAEDDLALQNFIRSTIRSKLEDKKYCELLNKWFTEFFAPYETEFDFDNYGQYWNYIKKHKIRSLNGDQVKSFEECEIANFLYTNGINYIYEANYEHETADNARRQYQPDFYLPDYQIYIEHLGLRGFGRTAPFVDRNKYLKSLRWKRNLHKQHGTILIETYSCQKSQGILTSSLKKKLEEKGVTFAELDGERIFDLLREKGRLDPFTGLVKTFLGHFKGSQLTEEVLRARNTLANEKSHARNTAFIDVFMPVFQDYQDQLREENKIDFHDMISLACKELADGNYQSPFRYIMVDEFQDISVGRSKLISALQKYDEDAQLFCVGDDWQSIFRFAGSDINLMKDFRSFFGNFERTDLSKTFRSEEKITKHATHFILQNTAQISKDVSSIRKHDDPSIFICFSKTEGEHYLLDILQQISNEVEEEAKPEVLILGRYNLKTYSNDYASVLSNSRLKFPDLSISFKTVHRSKGLEADYVIILEVIEDFLGFPNERADDHVLEMVLAKPEDFPNAEERRLFYVAMTRAKKKVFVCTESGKISPFVMELIQSPYDCEIWGKPPSSLPNCTKCIEGKLILKAGTKGNFWACNNYPYCEHTEQPCPHCNQGYPNASKGNHLQCDVCEQTIISCPRSNCSGHLQQEIGQYGPFWGCSKFRDTGCNYKTKQIAQASVDKSPQQWQIAEVNDELSDKKVERHHVQTRTNLPAKKSPQKLIPTQENIEELRKTVSNAYKPWTEEDDESLRRLVASGENMKKIANSMGRKVGAIRSRIAKLDI